MCLESPSNSLFRVVAVQQSHGKREHLTGQARQAAGGLRRLGRADPRHVGGGLISEGGG